MIADANFLKQLHEVDPTKISKETATTARDKLADVSGDKVKKVSSACYGIHEWNQGIIQAVLGNAENSETT